MAANEVAMCRNRDTFKWAVVRDLLGDGQLPLAVHNASNNNDDDGFHMISSIDHHDSAVSGQHSARVLDA